MSFDERVKQVYPKAAARSYQKQSGERYWLIWSDGHPLSEKRLGHGSTKREAWRDALIKILLPASCDLCDCKHPSCGKMKNSSSCHSILVRSKTHG
jgi:hypothetical protein